MKQVWQPIQWGVTVQREAPADCTPQAAEIWAVRIHRCHSSLFVPHGLTFPSVKWWTSLGAMIVSSWVEIWKREISRTNYSPITAVPPVIAIVFLFYFHSKSLPPSALRGAGLGGLSNDAPSWPLSWSLSLVTLCSSLIIRQGCAKRCQSGSQPCPLGPHWPHLLSLLPSLNSFCPVASVMFFQYPRHPSTFSEMLVLSAWTLSLDT